MRLLVTGGAGFIGSAFIRWTLKYRPGYEVVNFDALTYAGNLENLKDVEKNPRYRFVKGDICDAKAVTEALAGVDAVVHFAAESHNDRSVLGASQFFMTNVMGTQTLLDACLKAGGIRFHHVSTDEVYGDLALEETRRWTEDEPIKPGTLYSASKAGSDHAVLAYGKVMGLPVTVSRCCNNYGTHQFPEKLIPLFSTNAMEGKPLPLFKSSKNSREWIHADDHSSAVALILERGRLGQVYNIGSDVDKTIEEITDVILQTLGKPASLKTYVPDRPGHDRKYAIDSTKLRSELGWMPSVPFDDGMRETILWYKENPEWWMRVKSGDYRLYYDTYYRKVLGTVLS